MKTFAILIALALTLMLPRAILADPVQTTKTEKHTMNEIPAPDANLELVTGDLMFLEGPVWFPPGYLVFSDIPASTLYKWTPGKGLDVFRHPSGNANGNTLDKQGRLVTCQHDRHVTRTEADGTVTVLADRFEGKRLNSPNDVVVRSDGAIYFTDPPYGISKDQEELGFYGVYRIDKSGTLTCQVKDFVRPNGLAFSPDEKRLYVDDTEQQIIRVFDVNRAGDLSHGRIFADLHSPGEDGAPDGMKVDIKGNVYCTGAGGVWVFAPDGSLYGKIKTLVVAANLAFGDPDYKTLYITAQKNLYKIRVKIRGIAPGKHGKAAIKKPGMNLPGASSGVS